jgi:hypothetical protein
MLSYKYLNPRVPILNAFVTNIPNQMMPVQKMQVDVPDRQLAGSRGAILRSRLCRKIAK